MENKKSLPATQQPLTQQQLMAHHVHPDQIYSPQQTQLAAHLTSAQTGQIQPNGVMHQLLQSQYHSNMNARSPLLENRHELYGTGLNQDYTRHYGANDNYNYPQSPPGHERTDIHTDHNVNHELLHNIPKGYNAEVYQDYLKRNPPKDANQIYQNHQPMYRPNANAYGSKPYLPYSNRIGPQSNTELLRRQYNELQQMKLQQQMHYQNQAQMYQQQKFAERQLLLQQIHGVQPPPNLQNSIYSDGSYRDLDRYSSKNDFKDYSSPDIQKDIEMYTRNEIEKQNRHYLESQWQTNQPLEYRESDRHRRQSESDKSKPQSPPSDYSHQNEKNNIGVVSPMKSSESSSPSVKSPSSDSRRSSGGNQALRSPIAQRIPSAPVAMSGILYKQGSDGLKVWRKRWFVLSEYCLFYYKSQDEEKLLGSVLLPSYKVSACSSEDKVLRKYSFKLEHANMRTYVLAAPDQESMLKWVKALTMAALMQSPNEQPQKQIERPPAKTEEGDEVPGPTYANAPPKPRRSNEGYNSPSPDMYDPNYDILKKPASHYSQGTNHTRYQDHTNYPSSPNLESTYTRSPPPVQPTQYQTKRSYDTHHLSLPLTNTVSDKLENNQPSTSSAYKSNPQSPYFNDRSRYQHPRQPTQDNTQESLYDTQQPGPRNPFLQDNTPPMDDRNGSKEQAIQHNQSALEQERVQSNYHDDYSETREKSKSNIDSNVYNKDIYGEMTRSNRGPSVTNERLLVDRRTPDAYGRANTMASYTKGKIGDYEDVYGMYAAENEYGKTYAKSPPQSSQTNAGNNLSSQQRQQQQEYGGNYHQEKTFSGPSVLRRKKMQSSGIQPPVPRPHSADFLEYESKNETLNKTMPSTATCDPPRQPQRPKSSLDINSYYDPSSDRYYSEESYAEKMRQSAQYLQQQGLGPKNIQIPLAKYASGLAEKQLNSPYSQVTNNNYETEFAPKKPARDNISYNSKYSDLEGLNSNWTLKEKGIEHQKDVLNRSGSVMSDGSNISFVKENMSRFDPTSEGFMRSASARLPSTLTEKDGDKKVQQREESMKRLLEWKQRMLQSPLTRKSTPATISLARSLNQSRQSLRSDQYKSKTYTNATYNSYSSDDEEETSGTDVENSRDKQAGRSDRTNLTSHNITPLATPYAPCTDDLDILKINYSSSDIEGNKNGLLENTYENIETTLSIPNITKTCNSNENIYKGFNISENAEKIEDNENVNEDHERGYETHESEAESETQIEYTDNDLDEVLMDSDAEVDSITNSKSTDVKSSEEGHQIDNVQSSKKPETPPVVLGEDHYLPMSPRKTSTIELTHQMVLQNLSVFNDTMPVNYEDNPYVEMNIGNEEEDMQTYEVVCVSSGKVEPVYMELNLLNNDGKIDLDKPTTVLFDSASNFADTKDHTVKRVSKTEKASKKSDGSDSTDDEGTKDELPIDIPFNRFSISDTFRPASYYLSRSRNDLVRKESSDSDILSPPPIPSSTPPYEELSDEALSKYVLEKLDKSDMSQDNSILKMLTNENQTLRRRKTTSLMIYGSRTSIHDTLTRGEKIRNSRASLPNERKKLNEESPKLLTPAILENYNSSSIESDSLRSYNADRGSSRLSLESDISSKFEMAPSNLSSEVASLNESELAIDLRYPMSSYQNIEMMLKRRPLSDDSIFELSASKLCLNNETTSNVDLDRYLDKLQPIGESQHHQGSDINISTPESSVTHKDNNTLRTAQPPHVHIRCSSTPVGNSCKIHDNKHNNNHNKEQLILSNTGSQNSCSSVGITKSPISYYTKGYDEEQLLSKNLNKDISDKIKQFESEKLALKSGNETNASSTSTGFHSRDSSTEHSAPYYYSDLSSQEHINVLPTSHFLKNTNLHRRLNNQRRRGPVYKKNEISHIHNPIHNNQIFTERSFELVESARSVSVEFLSAADKDPEIDMKNIYESSDGRHSKIPESMNLISGLSCKRNSFYNNAEASSPDSNIGNRSAINTSSIQVSNTSMSSHCSGTSSNTVYYDAEADVGAYENICHGEKHWDEDILWRDNLRRVSHRHARSMDDLDTVESPLMSRITGDMNGMNSIKRVKKSIPNKISRHVTYVNCDIQGQLRMRESSANLQNSGFVEEEKSDDNDVYVSLAEDTEDNNIIPSDEGVYEQLAIDSSLGNARMLEMNSGIKSNTAVGNKKRFEIDREKLRQWDLMSSGLMKRGSGCVRGAGMGTNRTVCNMDTGTDNASNAGLL
ncbi:uncharacterized protein kmr isoform X2 [Plodia interpunctella]|nr:uncharacterized protein LOC128678407 isoform X2 [Plodia interpunctella]